MSNASPDDAPSLPRLERRLATILAADVEGYSRMMGSDEEGTVQTMRGHRAVFDALLQQHHGRVFNTAGDMILAEFPSAVEAVRCATEIQAALRTRNEHLAPAKRMRFRMGINLGDVVVQEGDLLGDGVNVAARIQTVAEPGGVCISSSVYDQIQNKLSLQFRSLGDRCFKNIGQPIRTFSIVTGDGGGAPRPAQPLGTRGLRIGAAIALCVAAFGAGGYWLYREYAARQAEQAALAAALDAQRRATEEARRALDTQREQAAASARTAAAERDASDAARREEALRAQLQAADDARRRAEAERRRQDAEVQQSRAAKDASAAQNDARPAMASAPPATLAPELPVTPKSTNSVVAQRSDRYDGTYDGVLCNHPNSTGKLACWPVTLTFQNGVATGSWTARSVQKPAQIRVRIEREGVATASLDGWSPVDGSALAGAMRGRLSDDHVDLSGRWATGMRVDGHWSRKQ